VLAADEIRRLSRVELVEYGRRSAKHRRQAADELFRRHHDRFLKRGLLDPAPEDRAREDDPESGTTLI
jgi:hypothetical protein